MICLSSVLICCSDKEDLPSIDSLFGSTIQPIILEISDQGIFDSYPYHMIIKV